MMPSFTALCTRFHRNEDAATAVEYAVMLALIAAVCLAAIQLVGIEASQIWVSNAEQVETVINQSRAGLQ